MSDVKAHLLFDSNGDLAVRHVQDVEPILERNKELRSQRQRSDWGRHVAEIPNVILTRWLNEEWARGNVSLRLFGPEMDALVDRKLKDPEWAYLRTDSAQVQSFLGFGS
jgi:hypothetical protein